MLLPLGRALSNGSLGRASRLSWSSAVKKKPAFLAVLEVGDHPVGQRPGLAQPAGVAGGGVEPEQAVGQEGVILEVGRELGLAQRGRSAAGGRRASRSFVEQEVGGLLGGLAVLLDLEDAVAVGIGGDHQAVPAGEDLVVAQRRGPLLAGRQQPGAQRRAAALPAPPAWSSSASACSAAGLRLVAGRSGPPSKLGSPSGRRPGRRRRRPGLRPARPSPRRASRRNTPPPRPWSRRRGPSRSPPPARSCSARRTRRWPRPRRASAGRSVISKASQVDRGELGVVVEHLLEVRDDPEPVGRVAVIAAAEVVADAAAGHPVERRAGPSPAGRADRSRPPCRASAVLIEQEDQVDRLGELGPARVVGVEAEPAVLGVELLGELRPAPRPPRSRESGSLRWPLAALSRLRTASVSGVGRLLDLGPLLRARPSPPR